MKMRTWRVVGGMLFATSALAAGIRADASGPAVEKKKAVAAANDEGDAKARPRARWLRVEVVDGTKDQREPAVSVRVPTAHVRNTWLIAVDQILGR